jgi:hypothetical protein
MKNSELYFKNHIDNKVILVDFDNTICVDEWPNIGELIPGALDVLKKLQDNGHTLILYTQRSNNFPICCDELRKYANDHHELVNNNCVDILTPVINFIKERGVEFDYINENKDWETITGDDSRKVFNDFVIDDHNLGINYNEVLNSNNELCKIVDWKYIDKQCVELGLYNEVIFK